MVDNYDGDVFKWQTHLRPFKFVCLYSGLTRLLNVCVKQLKPVFFTYSIKTEMELGGKRFELKDDNDNDNYEIDKWIM